MGFTFEIFLIFMLFFGGKHGGDLLDMMPTDRYWQMKHVSPSLEQLEADAAPEKKNANIPALLKDLSALDYRTRTDARQKLEAIGPAALPDMQQALHSSDPEVRATAADLVKTFELRGKERAIRRLMAIRTLGERHERAALDLLKSLQDSREMFVAAYARRAIAEIEGRNTDDADRLRRLSKQMADDLWLFPSRTGMVGQCTQVGDGSISVEKLMATLAVDGGGNGNLLVAAMAGGAVGGGAMGNGLPRLGAQQPLTADAMTRKSLDVLLRLVERIGNARIDGATIGISDNAGAELGWEIVIARGEFDSASMLAAAKALPKGHGEEIQVTRDGLADIIQMTDDTSIWLKSDHEMVIVMCDQEDDRRARLRGIVGAMGEGKGTIHTNGELMKTLKSVDRSAPVWWAGILNGEMRKDKGFAGFRTLTLEGHKQKEGGLSFTFHAAGLAPADVKASADALKGEIAAAQQSLPPVAALKPVGALLGSLHLQAAGKEAQLQGQLKPDLLESLVGEFGPFAMMEVVKQPLVGLPVNPPPQQ